MEIYSLKKLKTFGFIPFLIPLLSFGLHASALFAETPSFLPDEMIAGPGESKNNSITTGTRASLSLGTSSSFGSSANVSATDAYKVDAVSAFVPTSGSWKSSFGNSPDDIGVIKANVGNIRSSGPGSLWQNSSFDNNEQTATTELEDTVINELSSDDSASIESDSDSGTGYLIDATEASTAEGIASLEGATTDITIEINPDQTFTSTTITYLEDNADENPMATANGGASQALNNSLNVDLSNTSFSNAFSQSF